MRATHVTKWVHTICAQCKPNISWIICKLSIHRIDVSPLGRISRMPQIIIIVLVPFLMPAQQLSLLTCKHALHAGYYREIPCHLMRSSIPSFIIATIFSTLVSRDSTLQALSQICIITTEQDAIILTCVSFLLPIPQGKQSSQHCRWTQVFHSLLEAYHVADPAMP